MPYCSNCGVEVDESLKICPLCKNEINYKRDSMQDNTEFSDEDSTKYSRSRKMVFWELITFSLIVPIIIVILINLFQSSKLSWSLFVVLSLVASWIFITIPFFLMTQPVLFLIGYFINTYLFLLGIDAVNGNFEWFFSLAMPIIFIFYFLMAVTVAVSIRIKRKGVNIVAFILVVLSLFCVGIDFSILSYLSKPIKLGWSLIILIVVLPIALFLFYFDYRLSKYINLKKYFSVE